jgi:hypothetical protein
MSCACVRFVAALVGLCVVVGPAAAAEAPALAVEVDARELPRKLLHTTLDTRPAGRGRVVTGTAQSQTANSGWSGAPARRPGGPAAGAT